MGNVSEIIEGIWNHFASYNRHRHPLVVYHHLLSLEAVYQHVFPSYQACVAFLLLAVGQEPCGAGARVLPSVDSGRKVSSDSEDCVFGLGLSLTLRLLLCALLFPDPL